MKKTVPALALLLLAGAAGAARAQEPVPTLDRVDSLITAGQYELARSTLTRWWSVRDHFEVPGSDRARGLMLRARLSPDLDSAESDYLAIVLGYPTSVFAPEALLRLGQGFLQAGDASRAAAYLQRLVIDYPGRPQRILGLLWLARAETRLRRPAAACRAARDGLADARDPDLLAMLQVEEAASCAIGSGGSDSARANEPSHQPATPPRNPVAPPARKPTSPARAPGEHQPRPAAARPQTRTATAARPADAQPTGSDGRFAAQTGAFRYQRSVDALVTRLREAGYRPRVVHVPRNSLIRVRIGRFSTAAAAARLVRELEAHGFTAVVVGDADRERQP